MATATGAPPSDKLTERVRLISVQVRDLVAERDAQIVKARSTGVTVAALARAADLDVGTVRRILDRTS